jgi:hypothetical protein
MAAGTRSALPRRSSRGKPVSATAAAKLAGYAGPYLSVLCDRKMCLRV